MTVVIPTHNRVASLRRTLDALMRQTMAPDRYEIIVVDDGSSDGSDTLVRGWEGPVPISYLRQEQRGPAAARNNGVAHAAGDLVVFLDDDVVPSPGLLEEHTATHSRYTTAIVVGATRTVAPPEAGVFARLNAAADSDALDLARHADAHGRLPGTFCLSGNMSIRRITFQALGGFAEDLLGDRPGWSRWEDVELGWRAAQLEVPIFYNPQAVGYHHDYAGSDLAAHCRRWMTVAALAPYLFARHPDIEPHIPMLHDKAPVRLGQDSPRMAARKLLRYATATSPVTLVLESLSRHLERHLPHPRLLRPLYRWIAGAYMCRGYRQGLREFRRSSAATKRSPELTATQVISALGASPRAPSDAEAVRSD